MRIAGKCFSYASFIFSLGSPLPIHIVISSRNVEGPETNDKGQRHRATDNGKTKIPLRLLVKLALSFGERNFLVAEIDLLLSVVNFIVCEITVGVLCQLDSRT